MNGLRNSFDKSPSISFPDNKPTDLPRRSGLYPDYLSFRRRFSEDFDSLIRIRIDVAPPRLQRSIFSTILIPNSAQSLSEASSSDFDLNNRPCKSRLEGGTIKIYWTCAQSFSKLIHDKYEMKLKRQFKQHERQKIKQQFGHFLMSAVHMTNQKQYFQMKPRHKYWKQQKHDRI